LKLGARLAAGFGLVFALMVATIALAVARFTSAANDPQHFAGRLLVLRRLSWFRPGARQRAAFRTRA
jgi:hypothetical protein